MKEFIEPISPVKKEKKEKEEQIAEEETIGEMKYTLGIKIKAKCCGREAEHCTASVREQYRERKLDEEKLFPKLQCNSRECVTVGLVGLFPCLFSLFSLSLWHDFLISWSASLLHSTLARCLSSPVLHTG